MAISLHRLPLLIGSFLLLALAFLVSPTYAQEGENSHTVQPGDTLYRIATTYGLSVEQLARANSIINPSRIYAGQVLLIPQQDADLETTADDQDRDNEQQRNLTTIHLVQPGETITRVALHYSVTVQTLLQLNNLANPNYIYPGQELIVPATGATSTQAPPTQATQPAGSAARRIVVDKSEQRAYVYENGQLLWEFVISTGMAGSETWEGTFQVRSKVPNAYAYNWGLQMPYWLGFYHTGYLENGFHALPIQPNGSILWEGYLGTPVSYGCVILSYPDAEKLYQWATIGTEVIVQP